jgi:hypothetical protein
MQVAPNEANFDPPEFTDEQLRKVLKRVGEEARRRAFAAGRPVTVLEGANLVHIWPDGRREVIQDRTVQKERA